MRFIYTKAFAVFSACLTILVIGLFLQTKGFLAPIEYGLLQAPRPVITAVRSVTSPIKNFFTTLFTLRSIVRDNAKLTAQVAELAQKTATDDQLKLENALLKKELGFAEASKLNLQPCTVINANPQDLADALVINCGESQGLQEGQAVLAQGYLVGKIIYVGKYSSTALLITSANSSVDAKLSKNSTEAVVKGSFGSGVILDLVSQNADVQKGDIVVTAGIDSRLAKNLLIGEVGDVLSKPNDLFKRVSVVTPIRFHDIAFVFVAKP